MDAIDSIKNCTTSKIELTKSDAHTEPAKFLTSMQYIDESCSSAPKQDGALEVNMLVS